jgi:hypothetical protein
LDALLLSGGSGSACGGKTERLDTLRTPKYDPDVGELRALGRVLVLALPLAVAGCGGSDDGITSKTTSTGGGAATHSPARDSSPDAEYGTSLTIARDLDRLYHGTVRSKVKECAVGRLVLLLEQRRGKDRALGATRSGVAPVGLNAAGQFPEKDWAVFPALAIKLHRGARIYAEVPRDERPGYVCRADRSKVLLHQITND